jgi:hypothetical protein
MFPYTEEIRECEEPVDPSDELLLRQVGRHAWDDVQQTPTEIAFGPQTADVRRPSFSRADDAQGARDWHQKNAASPSIAVYGITSAEAAKAGPGLRTIDDSQCDDGTPKAPDHCYVDYRGLSRPQLREARLYLYMAAMKRQELPTHDIGHHLAGQESEQQPAS